MRFHTTAREYLTASELIRAEHPDVIVAYHCAIQALESVLKAFLRGKGWCIEHLSGRASRRGVSCIGHDLNRAWRHAKKQGIDKLVEVGAEDDDVVAMVRDVWKDRQTAYVRVGAVKLPSLGGLIDFVRRLVEGTQQFCSDRMALHNLKPTTGGAVDDVEESVEDVSIGCGCAIPDLTVER